MEKLNKKVLITGSSTGIGYACLKKFVSKGWYVLAHFYEKSSDFSSFCKKNQNKIEKLYVDFSNEQEVNTFLDIINHILGFYF